MKPTLLRISLLFSIILFTSLLLKAQNYPFPQNKVYSHGLMPTNRSGADAQSAYSTWKSNFLVSCSNGRYRVRFDDASQSVSEGIAYGMLLSAYAGERTIFDGLWNYYKDFRNSHGVMHWKTGNCSGIIGQNGATDSEVDAAMALIVAHYQWGSTGSINYQNDGKALIAAIKAYEVESGSNVLKPGDMFGGSNLTNPSYFAPGYFRVYASFTGDSFWNGVADKCHDVINKNLSVNNAAGGLVSDWCTGTGSHSSSAGGYYSGGTRYHYDAARTPWRIAVDYVWHGNASAKAYSKKSSDFVRVNLGGPQNVKDGYYQNGSAYGQWHNSTFAGGFACAAMGGDAQTHLNNSYADLKGINDANSYFNQTLKTMYLFLLTGNFYLPGGTTPPPTPTNTPPTVSITSPANNATFTSPASITINATAADANGTVNKVEFFQGTTKLGEDLSSPYSFVWSGVAAGSYSITAKATDNAGVSTTSSAISVTVTTSNTVTQSPYGGSAHPIPGKIEAERYDNGGSGVAYNDATAGNSGSAFRTENVDVETTSDAGGGYNVGWTAAGEWLEYTVTVSSAGKYDFNLRVATTATGKKVRVEMNGTSVTGSVTLPNTGGWQTWQTVKVAGVNLTAGQQIMRVYMETDGFNINYIDVTTATPTTTNAAPSVSITSPANNASFTAQGSITISAGANDSDGSISKVEFFSGSTKLGEDLSSPYSYRWTSVPAGSYILTAKATDNAGAVTTSAGVNITVTGSTTTNEAPSVSITSPANNASFTAPAIISISANASDSDGSINKVEFFSGSTKLGEDFSSPYSFAWSNVPEGAYTLTARATDNGGAVKTSSSISITVTTSSPTNCPVNAIPSASLWTVRNDWTDQANGSGVANTTDALKVTHRQWGKNLLWVVETGKTISVTAGKTYTITFEFKNDASNPVNSLSVGFAKGVDWSGAVLAQPAVNAGTSFSSSSFTLKTVSINSTYTGTVSLAFLQSWPAQPNLQVNTYLKNISVCSGTSSPRWATGTLTNESAAFEISPNPFQNEALVNVKHELRVPVKLIVSDISGRVREELNGFTNEGILIGKDLSSGIYIVHASYEGIQVMLKVVKN